MAGDLLFLGGEECLVRAFSLVHGNLQFSSFGVDCLKIGLSIVLGLLLLGKVGLQLDTEFFGLFAPFMRDNGTKGSKKSGE